MKKIPISMNDEEYAQALDLAKRFGMNSDVYGWFPKTVKASIKFTALFIDMLASFIPSMNDAEMAFLLQSVHISMRLRKAKESAENGLNELARYNHQLSKSIGTDIPSATKRQQKIDKGA